MVKVREEAKKRELSDELATMKRKFLVKVVDTFL